MSPARLPRPWLRPLGLVAFALLLLLLAYSSLAVTPALAQEDTPPAPNQPVSPAIVGGQDAAPGAYPWLVALFDRFANGEPNGLVCGGSLIAPDWVLTAAHCVVDAPPSRIDIVLGSNRLSSVTQRIPIDRAIVSSNYDPFGLDGDIALLHLTQSTTITPIQPFQLGQGMVETDYLRGTVTGWGLTGVFMVPDALQEVSLPIIDYTACAKSWSDSYYEFTDRLICAGYANMTKATCYGDSGGPLMVELGDGSWRQIGIVLGGQYGCIGGTWPDIFTRVSKYNDWIQACMANPDALACNGGDEYETDDNAQSAHLLTSFDVAQTHTFHTANDVDWIKLDAKAGHRYTIETRRLYTVTTSVDTVVWLYGADGHSALGFNEGPSEYSPLQYGKMVTDSVVIYQAPADGAVYAAVENLAPTYAYSWNYGPGARYELTVHDDAYQTYLPAIIRPRAE